MLLSSKNVKDRYILTAGPREARHKEYNATVAKLWKNLTKRFSCIGLLRRETLDTQGQAGMNSVWAMDMHSWNSCTLSAIKGARNALGDASREEEPPVEDYAPSP